MRIDLADVFLVVGFLVSGLGWYLVDPAFLVLWVGLVCFGAGFLRGTRRRE